MPQPPLHPAPPSSNPSRPAFTLIELLVVIAVLALLISMLLPALGKAKAISKQLKCGVQLGQIASLTSQYGSDYKDLFPPHRSAKFNNQDADWWWGTLIYTNYTDAGLLTGETNPKPDGKWSSTLWFPYIEATNEGVNVRHFSKGNVVFVDGHYESRADDQINNSIKFRNLWDPTLR